MITEFIRKLFQKDRYFFITYLWIDLAGNVNYGNSFVHIIDGRISDELVESLIDQDFVAGKATILFMYPISKKEYLLHGKNNKNLSA